MKDRDGGRICSIISLANIRRSAHLLPNFLALSHHRHGQAVPSLIFVIISLLTLLLTVISIELLFNETKKYLFMSYFCLCYFHTLELLALCFEAR